MISILCGNSGAQVESPVDRYKQGRRQAWLSESGGKSCLEVAPTDNRESRFSGEGWGEL